MIRATATAPARHRRRVTTGIAVIGCALLLAGCGRDPQLTALQGDPMATATFAHATLDRESTQKSGTTLGKPVYAQVLRAFTFHGVPAQTEFEQAVTTAERDGWTQTFRQGTGYIGTKTIRGVSAELGIHVGSPGPTDSLVVVLTAR